MIQRPSVVGLVVASASILWLCSCQAPNLATADRMARGLVLVLPGIEGPGPINVDIARGLDDGGVACGIEIFDWSTGSPAGLLIHLADLQRNMQQARRLARRIQRYQRTYPGRPVHLIGHSGGAGIVLLALEALPEELEVTSAILLAAAVSPTHDLRPALRRTRYGIYNFYSPGDVGFLRVGTGIFGTIDRAHSSSAGAVGFRVPADLPPAGRQLYACKLHQIAWSPRMRASGHAGGHLGWANRRFVRDYLAPMIIAQNESAAAYGAAPSRTRPKRPNKPPGP
ncbi:MAG: serine aminopeptidase domain-containing protein [Phycisphaerae bacterium]